MKESQVLRVALHPFSFHDGDVVYTVEELKEKIRSMDESTLRSFVNEEKHDFSTWIMYSLKDSDFALRLKDARDKNSLLEVLESYVPPEEEEVVKENPKKDLFKKFVETKRSNAVRENSKTSVEPEKTQEQKVTDDLKEQPVPKEVEEKAEELKRKETIKPSLKPKVKPAEVKVAEPAPKREVRPIPEVSHKPKEVTNTMITEEEAKRYADLFKRMREEIHKVYIGQDEIVQRIQLTLMCDAHALLEGVPGLAKSLLVEVLANVIEGTVFKRIQFLPDMLPSDVIGGQIYNPRTASFVTIKGPIFANFVLADEINRAPPKTHAALMEAMQEKKINIDKEEYDLDRPFLVLATQNPLENKGTYALPEAVLDRFMFKIDLDYPAREDEKIIITENATTRSIIEVRKVNYLMTKEEFLKMQGAIKTVHISDKIKEYILDIIEATRGLNKDIEGRQFVRYGGGPRASIYLGVAAKARAVMMGRNYVLPEDIVFVAPDVLRHRIALNFKGKAHNISSDKIIEEILSKVSAL